MAFKELSDNLKHGGDKTQEYIDTTTEYYKLRLFKSTMKFSTSLVNLLIIGSLSLLFLAFLSIGVALLLSNLIGYPSAGFFIVAAFFLIVVMLTAVFGKRFIIKKMLSKFSELLADENDKTNLASQKEIPFESNKPNEL